jgi:uncharacterized protein (DUF302 family)
MNVAATVRSQPFAGVRVVVDTPVPIDQVLHTLRASMGTASVPVLGVLARTAATQEQFAQQVTERFVGESGFMLFAEFDHGSWLQKFREAKPGEPQASRGDKFGIRRRTVRWVLGNPLIAITMIRHDITAGLFAPVEMLVTEQESGAGTTVIYVRPSSLVVIEENAPLREAAEVLDAKLESLVAKATATPDSRSPRERK